MKDFIVKLVVFYYKIRYVLTGKSRKDAFVEHVKKNGGKFVKYKKKQKRSGRFQKAPSIKSY